MLGATVLAWGTEALLIGVAAAVLGALRLRERRLERELRSALGRLAEVDRLANAGIIAAGAAHEINGPAAFVTANLQALQHYVATYEAAVAAQQGGAGAADEDLAAARADAARAVSESLEGMARLREIAQNLRALARRDAAPARPEPVPLGEVVETAVKTAHPQAAGTSVFVEALAPVTVLGNRGELVQVVLNLLLNALQAADTDRPNEVKVCVERDGRRAVLRVTDTGRGIPQEQQRLLFHRFFTTKPPGQGTGLGLVLAREIVRAHGGTIEAESVPDVGSTFTVRLPLRERPRA